jgi:undecaprenyl-phosphate galactose phosphotransferase
MGKNIKILFSLLIVDLLAYYTSLSLAFFTRKILNQFPLDIIHFNISFSKFIGLWWIPVVFIFFYCL